MAAPDQPPHGQGDEPEAVQQKHLSEALRVGFVVLSLGMTVVLVVFALSGASSIDIKERGIKKIFGRDTEVVSEGLSITWPFPIGEIEKVPVDQQTFSIEEFYFHRTDEEKRMDLDRIRARKSLRPGIDGALLTGDQGLLHVRMTVSYQITDVLAVKRCLPPDRRENVPEYERRAFDETFLRNEVSAAAIEAMATRTAMAVSRGKAAEFQKDVEEISQRRLNVLTVDRRAVSAARANLQAILDELPQARRQEASAVLRDLLSHLGSAQRHHVQELRDTLAQLAETRGAVVRALTGQLVGLYDRPAIQINNVIVEQDITWPLAARAAWRQAEDAATIGHSMVQTAREEASKILDQSAGGNYSKLISFDRILGEAVVDATASEGLIDQYVAAVEAGQGDRAAEILDDIDRVLVSDATGGTARRMIERASSFATNISKNAEGRLDEYNSKLQGYLQSPELTLQTLWAETRQRCLANPLAEKFYLPVWADQKIVLKLGPDPAIRREIDRMWRQFLKDTGSAEPSPTPVEGRHD